MAGFDHTISIVLKVKNAAQAKKEIDSVISNTTLGKVKGYNAETKKTDETQKKVAKSARKARSGIKQFTGTIFSSLAVMALFNRALRGSINLFDEAAGFERVGNAFEQTVGKMNQYLPELRRSTRGVVDDMNLLKVSTRAVTEGLGKDKLSSVFKQATVASRKLGLSTKDTIATITKAITRHDESAMTTLGIIIKNNKAYQMMQKAIGAIKGPANAAVKIQMRHSFIMSQLTEKYGTFNSLQRDSLEILNQSRTAWSNFKISAGKIMISVLQPLIEGFTGLVNSSSGFFAMVQNNKGMSKFVSSLGSVSVIVAGIATTLGAIKLASSAGLFSFLMNPAVLLGSVAALSLGVTTEFGDIEKVFSKVGLAASVFFQLLGNYNSGTGMTSVLTKDKNALGDLYGLVFNLAKGFKIFQAVGMGVLSGIAEALKGMIGPLGNLGGWLGNLIGIFTEGKPVTQDFLNTTRDVFQSTAKWATRIYVVSKAVNTLASGLNKVGDILLRIAPLLGSMGLYEIGTGLSEVTTGGLITKAARGLNKSGIAGMGGAAAASLGPIDDIADKYFPIPERFQNSRPDAPKVSTTQSSLNDAEEMNGESSGKILKDVRELLEKKDERDTRQEEREVKKEIKRDTIPLDRPVLSWD